MFESYTQLSVCSLSKKHLNPLDHSDPCREAELNLLFSTAVFYMTPELGIVGTGGYVISIPIKSSQ